MLSNWTREYSETIPSKEFELLVISVFSFFGKSLHEKFGFEKKPVVQKDCQKHPACRNKTVAVRPYLNLLVVS